MNQISLVFERAKKENRAALIGFITAGFPDKNKSFEIATAMVEGGVDLIEVGFPYSDPVMDGPVIQNAGEVALSNGVKSKDVIELVSKISNLGIPVLVMTYWNPIEKYGVSKFASELKNAHGAGLITPDLTVEEASEWNKVADTLELAKVYVLAPSSSDERVKLISDNASGFIYAASLMGVTGVRNSLTNDASKLVSRIKKESSLPVAVGLGVSNGEQAKAVASYADGVIVGSAFIKIIQTLKDFDSAKVGVKRLAQELRAGVER
jgi:tryptophan synthase alpha chain